MSGFIHLHVHSYYSFFDSTLSPRQIMEFAQAQGMSHIALTDTNILTGLMEFNLHCQEAGIKPILGTEVRQPLAVHRRMLAKRAWKYQGEGAEDVGDFDSEDETQKDIAAKLKSSGSPMLWHGDRECRAVLLARNMVGYTAISHLVTHRHLEADFDLLEEVAALDNSVILLSDCPVVLEAARLGDCEIYGELIASPRRRRQNRQVYDHCLAHNIPLVMTADAKMLSSDERKVHNLLRAMGTLSTIDNLADDEKIDPCQHLQTDADVQDFFMLGRDPSPDLKDYHHHLHEAYRNTQRIAEACQCDLPYREWQFPELKLEKKDPGKILEEVTWEGIRERYGDPPPEEVNERTRRELKVIGDLGFTQYFLLVRRIIKEAESRGLFTIGGAARPTPSSLTRCVSLTSVP